MKPNATIATGLVVSLLAGPASAQSQTPPPPQSTPATQTPPATQAAAPVSAQIKSLSAENLDRIREAVNREPSLRIENGQLRIYVEVIGNWPTFAEYAKGYDFINGPTGYGNPMSHAEFVAMSTPQDLYSSAGIKPGEVVTMAAVNVVGQWAIGKALTKIGNMQKNKQAKQINAIRAQIDADLAAIKKEKEKEK